MTTYQMADIGQWEAKINRNIDLILKEACQELFRLATQRQASVKETGGVFEVGKIPVDTGALIASTQVTLNGSLVSEGQGKEPADFVVAIAQLEGGDVIQLEFTAEHARAIEYGTGNIAGRFFVRTAASQWQKIVAEAVRKVTGHL